MNLALEVLSHVHALTFVPIGSKLFAPYVPDKTYKELEDQLGASSVHPAIPHIGTVRPFKSPGMLPEWTRD